MNSNTTTSPIVGIDIGRVLMTPADPAGRADTSFLSGSEERALSTPATPGAFEATRTIVEWTAGNAWLVSKCGARIERLTRKWLERQGFFGATGFDPSHLRFCRERPEKRLHAQELHLTHFIDDRVDVLEHLQGVVPARILFGHQSGDTLVPSDVVHAPDWPSVLEALGLALDAQELRRHLAAEPHPVRGETEGVSLA